MSEKLQLTVTKSNLEDLTKGKITIDAFLNKLLSVKEHHALMCAGLQEYHRNDGGSPEVHAFEIVHASFNPDNLIGHFTCKFRVKYHYTCSDVRNEASDTITWSFKPDIANCTLNLTGEKVLERDGDEF